MQGNGNNLNIVTAKGEIYEGLGSKNTEVTNVKQLIASNGARYALTKDGKVYAKGSIYTGGWGDGLARDNYVEITLDGINSLPKIEKMYITNYEGAAIVITEGNEIYWFGTDHYTKFPNVVGDVVVLSVNRIVTLYPKNITNNGAILSNIKNKIKDIQINYTGPSVGAEGGNTLILTTDGELYTFSNRANLSGNGTIQTDFERLNIDNKKVVNVKTRRNISFAITEDRRGICVGI